MTVNCKVPATHRRWGEWSDDGTRGWCRLCSPADAPRGPDTAPPESPQDGPRADVPRDTFDTRPEAWRRLFRPEERER